MPSKRKRQTRLIFESTGAESSPAQQFSPAKIRYSQSSQVRSSPSLPGTTSRRASSKRTQRSFQPSLENMKGLRKTSKGSALATRSVPASSFMPRSQRAVVDLDSSDEEAVDVGGEARGGSSDSEDEVLPSSTNLAHQPASSQSVSTRLKRTVISDDDEEEDEEDDLPIAPSSSRRRPTVVELESDSDVSPTKRRKTIWKTHGSSNSAAQGRTAESSATRRLVRKTQPSSSPTRRAIGHRTEKQKNMELLRRRRAGEKIDKLTSSESESGDNKRGLYDTDSDDELQVLDEFPDDEDEDVEPEEHVMLAARNGSSKKASRSEDQDDLEENDLDDFVVEDDDAPIGAPLNLEMPLEFTSQAHKPLKEQFPHVIEWLIHNRINPAFERRDPVYTNAWRKLDDEVKALASSKFVSSVWKVEFNRALRARPKFESFEMGHGDSSLYDKCEACGRSGHPATWKIHFEGRPYHNDTLEDLESDSEESDSDSEADSDDSLGKVSVDLDGNSLLPVSKDWLVGSVCCSNAETAHSLIHWKHALKEWVEDRLESDGHMTAQKLQERDKMKPKKRREAANKIADEWEGQKVTSSLYNDFKGVLRSARDKSTTGRRGQRWR